MKNTKNIANFLIELAGAKTAPRTGWQRIGIKSPESLADHAALSGQIAYVFGGNGRAPIRIAPPRWRYFVDVAQLRAGDQNWVNRIYSDYENEKEKAQNDQLDGLPVAGRMKDIFNEIKECKTKEAIIAKDADFFGIWRSKRSIILPMATKKRGYGLKALKMFLGPTRQRKFLNR